MVSSLGLGACSQDCNSAGFASGFSISLPSRSWGLAEFCIDEESLPPASLPNGDGFIEVGDEPAEYDFRVRLVKPDGTEVTQEGTVRTVPFRGNGKGCEPLTANAVVMVNEDGTATAHKP